ncbi:hypothetical protein CC1G_05323 [Coprinopsis cinerea okayama7|uniref:Cell polarity protein mor2 n=1 Tax=Coprinopsis cinerea (strain Okayama-7 / 130 / ATCC MYA-4618 / FGSC 9003) TaxID=240176 RepID=A8PCM8_COPC7|nr:hypothetical protein CC1G_05323 [Coprinopsis cinerea okayama7\|eukprot:XP_001840437.2 hypothetical protein CC1G_05323 [Coprinopsis cinerea okayama7\
MTTHQRQYHLDGQDLDLERLGFGERSFFHHARGDSIASVDSANSGTTRFTSKPSTPFGHSSQSSITTTSNTGFISKKPSFASIRNAFKGNKNNDAPPVPQLETSTPYPVLKNPFNRSTSSLNSPRTIQRPSTTTGSTRGKSTSRGHTYAKSQHSLASDGGSDYGHGFFSPPPVPRVPGAYRSDTPPTSDFEDDKVDMNPKTPSDYALHAVFMRFASLAEDKINDYLRQPLEPELPFAKTMGPGEDPKFDDVLQSLAIIAQKNAKPVIDSVMRWRRSQNEIGSGILDLHGHSKGHIILEKKSMASIYIMCRALVAVLQNISKDSLGDAFGYTIEETFFEQFRRPESKHQHSVNHRSNTELYAALLGHLAKVRFVPVTDRFMKELEPVTLGQIPKDFDNKYENLVRGMRYIQIKVWPPEAFEEGAEFMEVLSKTYVNAHGARLKTAFAEILVLLLHPIGKTAQAETNIPSWGKAIEIIYPKSREMVSKPRYWATAFPLAITALCVGPQTFFLKHWQACIEGSLSKLKDKPSRIPVLNGIMRVAWTYLYRCQETPSTTMSKLESLLKHFFPSNRLTVTSPEDSIDFLTYIVHFILSRHFEYGKDLCLELVQESAINSLSKSGNISNTMAPERTLIAINAILMTLYQLEKEVPTPSWPSSSDFSTPPSRDDYPSSSTYLPTTLGSKPGIKDLLERAGACLSTLVNFASNAVAHMCVFDEQWSYTRMNASYEEANNFVIRHHADGTIVAYPSGTSAYISILQTAFNSWPRCMHSSILMADAVDLLLRGVVHVEPALSDAAIAALKRLMEDRTNALTVVARFTSFVFSNGRPSSEASSIKLYVESPMLVALWVDIVEAWLASVKQLKKEEFSEESDIILAKCDDIEAAGLFLLSREMPLTHSAGVKVIRMLGLVLNHLKSIECAPGEEHLHFVELLHEPGREDAPYLTGFDNLLERPQLTRLEQWRQVKKEGLLLRIADSNGGKDPGLWRYIFPSFLKTYLDHPGSTLQAFREMVVVAVQRYHPIISHLAGLSSRVPAGFNIRPGERNSSRLLREHKPLVDQWHMWVKILCSTAVLPESSRPPFTPLGRDHSRAPSDISFERERLSTSRGLFRHLTPFLDSEHTSFRDAATQCISSFPPNTYPQLLEDLSLLAGRQFYDDPRSKAGTPMIPEDPRFRYARDTMQQERNRRQERLHSAVARIYCLTAHCLQHQRLAGRQAALANVLKFVRNTQTFLSSPEARDNPALQRLRRYFCGTVERLFDGLASLKDSDRFIPKHMHLSLYRLCEDWCQVGPQSETARKRMEMMMRTITAGADNQDDATDELDRFKEETAMLSYAAIGALTSLCQKAFFPSDGAAPSPTDRQMPEYTRPLTALQVLERLDAILGSSHKATQTKGKKGLKSLLTFTHSDGELRVEVLRRAAIVTNKREASSEPIFEVISEIVCKDTHHFSFEQVVCLGLTNLRHPSVRIRTMAFDMLEAIHQQHSGLLAMSTFAPAVSSLAPGTYIYAHRQVADFLAGEHPHQANKMLVQLSYWLPSLHPHAFETNVILLLLQSFEFWIPNITLSSEPGDELKLSKDTIQALFHLMKLSLHYQDSYSEQILILWSKLVEAPNQANGDATIQFLVEQSQKVGNTIYVECAANIVACLCQTPIGGRVFEELCSIIVPVRMLPTIDHKLSFPDAESMTLWEDLDALFADHPRLTIGAAQSAWLFLSDVSLQRYWELTSQLPILLHATFTHLDHRVPFVRLRARSMLFQLLRSWVPGYDELADRSHQRSHSIVKERMLTFQQEIERYYWSDDESSADVEPKMSWVCQQILEFLEPLSPNLASAWGTVALEWGTACSVRAVAFRSLQLFRALMPRVKKTDLAHLLGRLSNTISLNDKNIQTFTSEIFLTLRAVIDSQGTDKTLLPQIFWCISACLSTTVESEFGQCLDLLEAVVSKVDFDNPEVTELLLSQMPQKWQGSEYLQPNLLKGLRSSATSTKTIEVLQSLAQFREARVIDPTDGRLRDLYTASLPWCLHAMDNQDTSLSVFAERIAALAQVEGKNSIARIMTSFSKSHFRTRDDFLRQSVSSLREHYGARYWTEVVTLLLGLVLNSQRWLRIHSMQVLKVLFQHRETRNPVELLGSELLMPLLRLLETDLAPQALEVLEEPISMFGGPAAKHVLRMSMHMGSMQLGGSGMKDGNEEVKTVVFGVPEESGWSIAQEKEMREMCQTNVLGVFDTCSIPTRPSRIEFEPEVEALANIATPIAHPAMTDPNPPATNGINTLSNRSGGLQLKNFHELNEFFQNPELVAAAQSPVPIPTRRLEARVAAILAKSTAPESNISDHGVPQTPFIDVFRIGGGPDDSIQEQDSEDDDDDDDDSSDSDSDADSFIFDSIASPRVGGGSNGVAMVNGHGRHH